MSARSGVPTCADIRRTFLVQGRACSRCDPNAHSKNEDRSGATVQWSGLAALALVVGSAGCFSEIFPGPPVSTLAFACAAIDPLLASDLVIVSYTEDDIEIPAEDAIGVLAARLAEVSGRDATLISVLPRDAPEAPESGWNESRLAAWVRDEPFLGRGQVTLRVLWIETLEEGTLAGLVPAPGAVVLSQAAIAAGAVRINRTTQEVATAVLLHFTGHALGVTNRGIPVQDPALQEREGPPGHDADPASVLAVGWNDAQTMAWAANATYDHYPEAVLADWQAAREPGGVCEVRR